MAVPQRRRNRLLGYARQATECTLKRVCRMSAAGTMMRKLSTALGPHFFMQVFAAPPHFVLASESEVLIRSTELHSIVESGDSQFLH